MNNVLILGAHSFVASGLASKLVSEHCCVEAFSRGEECRKGNHIYGDYLNLPDNQFFKDNYDVVINFAILKDGSVNDNINYIKALLEFCKKHKIKKLIHFSSIMVYNYQLKEVDEDTYIEGVDETYKDGYGKIKIAVDQYLMNQKADLSFETILVRPGFVLSADRVCPFIKKLPLGFSIIKGNKKSKQPIVRREQIHEALLRIIESDEDLPVYHFFPNDGMTKYRYAQMTTKGIILILPKWIFKYIPFVLMKMRLMSKSLYSRFEGMYIESDFSSLKTERKLDIKFE